MQVPMALNWPGRRADRAHQRQARLRLGLPTEIEGRLPPGQAVLVIASLSVLSWAVLIATIVALRAML